MTKEKAQEVLDKSPDDFSLDEFIERLLFIQSVEEGLQSLDEGRVRHS